MELFIMGSIYKEKKMDMASLFGRINKATLEISKTIIFMELAFINGAMEESLKEIGNIIKCMVEVNLNGKTVDNIMDNFLKTKNKALGNSYGQMAVNIMDSGWMENKMVWVNTILSTEKQSMGYGLMGRELNG